MSESDFELVVRLVDGSSDRREMVLRPGAGEAPISIGARGAWRVEAEGVAPAHLMLAWSGSSLFLSAAPGAAAMLNGAPLGAEWVEAKRFSEVQFGQARIVIMQRQVNAPSDNRALPCEAVTQLGDTDELAEAIDRLRADRGAAAPASATSAASAGIAATVRPQVPGAANRTVMFDEHDALVLRTSLGVATTEVPPSMRRGVSAAAHTAAVAGARPAPEPRPQRPDISFHPPGAAREATAPSARLPAPPSVPSLAVPSPRPAPPPSVVQGPSRRPSHPPSMGQPRTLASEGLQAYDARAHRPPAPSLSSPGSYAPGYPQPGYPVQEDPRRGGAQTGYAQQGYLQNGYVQSGPSQVGRGPDPAYFRPVESPRAAPPPGYSPSPAPDAGRSREPQVEVVSAGQRSRPASVEVVSAPRHAPMSPRPASSSRGEAGGVASARSAPVGPASQAPMPPTQAPPAPASLGVGSYVPTMAQPAVGAGVMAPAPMAAPPFVDDSPAELPIRKFDHVVASTWKGASPARRALAVLVGPALVAGIFMLREAPIQAAVEGPASPPTAAASNGAPPVTQPLAARTAAVPTPQVMPTAHVAAAGTPSSPAEGVTPAPGAAISAQAAQVAQGASSGSAGGIATAAASAASAASSAAPRASGSAKAGAKTPDRVALDAVASGAFASASEQYAALSAAHPENRAYREAARILRERSNAGAKGAN